MTRSTTFDDSPYAAAAFRGIAGSSRWDSGLLTYHLEFSDFDRDGVNDWSEDDARAAIEQAFAVWAAVGDFSFTPTARFQDANLIERISGAEGNLGFHFLPGGNSDPNVYANGRQSDGEFNKDGRGWDADGLQQGGYAFITLTHEIGHALGLEHPFDADVLAGVGGPFTAGWFDLNQGVYTTMAYADGWALRGGSDTNDFGWQGTPMALDVAAIQAKYGANDAQALGDDAYALGDANGSGTFYSAIWDAGGTDAITYAGGRDAFVFLDEATIDDTATAGGLVSYVEGVTGGFTIAQNAVIENASTGSGDDLIAGNGTGNVLRAGAGADTIYGLDGNDLIEGGAGGDLLVGDYVQVAEFGGPSLSVADGPDLPGGLSRGDGAVTAGRSSANDTRARAIDLSDQFRLSSDDDALGGTQAHTVEVSGTGGGALDQFRLTLTERALITADIDSAWTAGTASTGGAGDFDSVLSLVASDGFTLAQNDDSRAVQGGAGSGVAYRSGDFSLDSYLAVVLDPGTYFLVVGEYADTDEGYDDIRSGGTYTLQLSADARAPASLPTDALGQLAYYYEQPDYGDFAEAAFAVPGTGDRGTRAGKEDEGGHSHDHGRGGTGPGRSGRGGHAEGCGCAGCQDATSEADDTAFETRLFAFDTELDAFLADDAQIA